MTHKTDAPMLRDWSAKGDVRKIIKEYLAEEYLAEECPDEDKDRALTFYQHRCSVLQRLARDQRACAATSAIAKTVIELWDLLDLCTDAEWLLTAFPKVLTEERKMVERLRRHRQSVKDLREFINQVSKHPDHPVVGRVSITKTEEKKYRDVLSNIASLIELRQLTANIAVFDLRVTRKSTAQAAAETAAIKKLAHDVMSTFGKPFAPQVAILAEVAFGIGNVTEDRVREALKAHRRKQ
jgi:hypothetical protein